MNYKLKKNDLSDRVKPLDDQLKIDPDKVFGRKNFIYLAVGKKGSGKTTLILSLFNTPDKEGGFKKRFDRVYLVSPTARNDPKMDDLVEELDRQGTYYDEIDNDTVKEIIEDLKVYNNAYEGKGAPESCIWFDDCIHSLPSNRKRNQAFNKLMTTNRHLKTCVLISSQRLNELNPLIRSQADIVSYFRSDNNKEDDIFTDTYNVSQDLLDVCVEQPNSFITVSYAHKRPKVYCRFDELEKEEIKKDD
jgi:hypothetical protein